MALQDEIDKARAEIRTDGYSMSISELISLYQSDEIDIHPEFQIYFRWSPFQKSRLIESILLGIPIPQVFVAQRQDGLWDVVDGLHRLSTIYEFVGILKDEKGEQIPPLVLEKTKYLPSLAGKKWEDKHKPEKSFTSVQRLIIKRSKINVSIILKESDESSKYELFQRLHTGGAPLSDQEVRNSILVMMNPEMYRWMRNLSQNENFQECIALTDRAIAEQYDMDLLLRFIILRTLPERQLKEIGDIGEILTDRMIKVAETKELNLEEEEQAFKTTFSLLREQLGSQSFHKYDVSKDKFLGGFLGSAYEAVALGIGYNYRNLSEVKQNIQNIIKNLWQNEEFISNSGTGVRASSRVPHIIPLGRSIFHP